MRRLFAFALFAALAAATPAFALEVRTVLWGFNGQVVPHRFNILSVLVENETTQPFDGTLQARRVDFNLPVGPWIAEPCYLAPFTARWVQFPIFIEETEETWTLSWGKSAKESAMLPAARLGPPATALLSAEESRGDAGGQVKRFPEGLFPTNVTLTDGLRAVVLDHVPKWEEARRRAFMDWVRLGGTVHVARNSFGEYPEFREELAALGTEGAVGLGRVARHDRPARELSDEALDSAGFPPAQLDYAPQGGVWGAVSLADEVMRSLTEVSRTRHNWWMIFSFAGVYFLLIGPVNWLAGKRMEYRRVLLYFVAVVAACSVLMLFVGQRGRRRSERIYTVTEARPLGGGQYALRQWTTLFATRGSHYAVGHPADATGCVYATPGVRAQTGQGVIVNGRGGGVQVDIPINSSRFMAHCAKAPGKEWAPEVSGWSQMESGEFSVGGTLPPDIIHAYATAEGKWTQLHPEAGRLRALTGTTDYPGGMMGYAPRRVGIPGPDDPDEDAERLLRSCALTIMAEASGATQNFYNAVSDPARPTRHLFIACDGSGEFNLAANRLGKERNIIVYHYSYHATGN